MAAFYKRETGAVVSFTIDKYLYISLNRKFDGKTRVSYSVTENVDDPKYLKHDLARAALIHYGCNGLEIVSVSDIPGEGTGLGSSSSFTVGLLKALLVHSDIDLDPHPRVLAELGYQIEHGICAHPAGKQDHYAAAHGGLRYYQFNRDDSVDVAFMDNKEVIRGLESNLMLFYTRTTRQALQILSEQTQRLQRDTRVGIKLRNLAMELQGYLLRGDYQCVGDLLNIAWGLKKQLASDVSNSWIDELYSRALEAGATGGKLLGAGGGGFFLFAVPAEKQESVTSTLGLMQVPFRIEHEGSKVIYDSEK